MIVAAYKNTKLDISKWQGTVHPRTGHEDQEGE
jgi:hypothetical protein